MKALNQNKSVPESLKTPFVMRNVIHLLSAIYYMLEKSNFSHGCLLRAIARKECETMFDS